MGDGPPGPSPRSATENKKIGILYRIEVSMHNTKKIILVYVGCEISLV